MSCFLWLCIVVFLNNTFLQTLAPLSHNNLYNNLFSWHFETCFPVLSKTQEVQSTNWILSKYAKTLLQIKGPRNIQHMILDSWSLTAGKGKKYSSILFHLASTFGLKPVSSTHKYWKSQNFKQDQWQNLPFHQQTKIWSRPTCPSWAHKWGPQ